MIRVLAAVGIIFFSYASVRIVVDAIIPLDAVVDVQKPPLVSKIPGAVTVYQTEMILNLSAYNVLKAATKPRHISAKFYDVLWFTFRNVEAKNWLSEQMYRLSSVYFLQNVNAAYYVRGWQDSAIYHSDGQADCCLDLPPHRAFGKLEVQINKRQSSLKLLISDSARLKRGIVGSIRSKFGLRQSLRGVVGCFMRGQQSFANQDKTKAAHYNTRNGRYEHQEGPFGHIPRGVKIGFLAPFLPIGFWIARRGWHSREDWGFPLVILGCGVTCAALVLMVV